MLLRLELIAQNSAKELQRVKYMKVPILPVVLAGVFLVLVRDAQRVQVRVQGAVLFDEEVVHAAVEAQGGSGRGVRLLCQREDVICASAKTSSGPPAGASPNTGRHSRPQSSSREKSRRAKPSAPEWLTAAQNRPGCFSASLNAP